MSAECARIHRAFLELEHHRFPFDQSRIPKNGLYALFEEGEPGHGTHRVVRIGTHRGPNQMRSRLRQHFVKENKDRSIFRKNIGRALLHQREDPYLADWNLDLTSASAKAQHGPRIDLSKQKAVEAEVTAILRARFFFTVFEVLDVEDRLRLESRLISTVCACAECGPSRTWLGLSSSVPKIRESGLWQIQELYKTTITASELEAFERLVSASRSPSAG